MKSKYLNYFLPIMFFFLSMITEAQIKKPDHVLVVILENHAYEQIIGSKAAPYINSLINNKHCALFTNSFAVTHPSQPNYLAFFAGSTCGIDNDDRPKNLPFSEPNLGAELLSHSYSFAGYSEDLPSTGYNGNYLGNYARRHNPWVNWQDSKINGIPKKLNLSFKDFPSDYRKLPTVSFVIPNVKNDMHDGKDPDRIILGDKWIKKNLSGLIKWSLKHNSLIIFTFDEDNDLNGNHIPTFFIGEMVKGGSYSEKINHYYVLRTIEDFYNLPFAGESKNVEPIKNCWIKAKEKN
ncbi:MAG: alkaline phosphatase family protein [Bacteroidetes bacterium]|nr:alkaline phosphatase family protein [Bacteroidota bacterium]